MRGQFKGRKGHGGGHAPAGEGAAAPAAPAAP
jgi:hypothetical protein